MSYRPADLLGDWQPIQTSNQLLYGARAVAASIQGRLHFYRGEWWEDTELGFAIPDFLADGVRGGDKAEMLKNYIVSYVRQTDGVVSVPDATYTVNGRDYSCTLSVLTEYGTVSEEVDSHVIYGALSE